MSDELALTHDEREVVEPLIVDLGKVKRKKIKDLKRGLGPLRDQIDQIVAEVAGDRDVIPVIILCRKAPRRRGLFGR